MIVPYLKVSLFFYSIFLLELTSICFLLARDIASLYGMSAGHPLLEMVPVLFVSPFCEDLICFFCFYLSLELLFQYILLSRALLVISNVWLVFLLALSTIPSLLSLVLIVLLLLLFIITSLKPLKRWLLRSVVCSSTLPVYLLRNRLYIYRWIYFVVYLNRWLLRLSIFTRSLTRHTALRSPHIVRQQCRHLRWFIRFAIF